MGEYKITNIVLDNVKYNSVKLQGKSIVLSVNDEIEIVEIQDKNAIFNVSRALSFCEGDEPVVRAGYNVILQNDEPIDKQDLLEALKNNKISFYIVFSKISLIISQITNLSPYGTIVTTPMCDMKKVKIIWFSTPLRKRFLFLEGVFIK